MLRYKQPAKDWNEALPIGNGRLGAMVYGRTDTELIRLNEDSVWYGGPQDRMPRDAREALPTLRHLIKTGDHVAAEKLVRQRFVSTPINSRHYEPLGVLTMEFDYGPGDSAITDYQRHLDLENGVISVDYRVNGIRCTRQALVSEPDNVVTVRIQSDEAVMTTIKLNRLSEIEYETNEFYDSLGVQRGCIVLKAAPGGIGSNKLCIAAGVCLEADNGHWQVVGKSLVVTSKAFRLIVSAETTYRHSDPEVACVAAVNKVSAIASTELWQRYYLDRKTHINRMSLELSPDDSEVYTNERLTNAIIYPGLAALYVNYGRHLLLSSSRPSEKALPANLQGIWNASFQPAWGSKFTININLQMNYWLAHTANLSACERPLFDLLQRMAERGQKTASEMYGCPGWCAHSCTDIWADTDPHDVWMPATLWPLGGAWLCTHIWENYAFTGEKMLLWRMLPVLSGCVHFLLSFLQKSASGKHLVTNPSLSPENSYLTANGQRAYFCEGSTIDTEIVCTVFEDYIKIGQELNGDCKLRPRIEAAFPLLQPIAIDPVAGTIQEWGLAQFAEAEPGHRHVSHLLGFYPGARYTTLEHPELCAAAAQTLRSRLDHGGGHTGWSRAWLIGLWARLRYPEEVEANIHALFRTSTLPNLLSTHPPFQIDGNFGGSAGTIEALVQSHEELDFGHLPITAHSWDNVPGISVATDDSMGAEGMKLRVIRLLPACPKSWQKGRIRGVKARGGFEVDFAWEDGVVKAPITVRSVRKTPAILCVHEAGSGYASGGRWVRLTEEVGEQLI